MNREERRAMERATRRAPKTAMFRKAKMAHGRLHAQSGLDESQIRDLSLFAHASLTAITRGEGTPVDIDNLALVSNMALVLSQLGLGLDLQPAIMDAQDAVVSMQSRLARTGKVGASGPELQAVNVLLEVHDAQLEIPPTVEEMRKAVAEVKRRRESGQVIGIEYREEA